MPIFTKLNLVTLIFAIIIRSCLELIIPDPPTTDLAHQLTSAKNLINNKGISLATVQPTDLANINYNPLALWPPGYALLSAPLFLMGFDAVPVVTAIDIISIIIFFVSWHFIFTILRHKIPPYFPSLVYIYWTFSISPFRHLWPTDLLALALFLPALAMLLYILKTGTSKHGFPVIILFAFLSFLPSFIRYAYYPVSISFSVILLFHSYIVRKELIKFSIITFLFSLFFILLQVGYLHLYANDFFYLDDYHPNPSKIFYFEHLKDINPVVLNSFFDPFLLKKLFSSKTVALLNIFLTLSAIAFLVGFFKHLILVKIKSWNILQWFILSGVFLILVQAGLLVLLSLKYPYESESWTYVKETRYYSLTLIFVPVLIFLLVVNNSVVKKISRATGIIMLVSSFIFSISINTYLLNKYSITSPIKNMCQYYHFSYDFFSFLRQNGERFNGDLYVFYNLQTNEIVKGLVEIEHIPILDVKNSFCDVATSKNIKLLIALDDEHRPNVICLFNKYSFRKIQRFEDIKVEIWEGTIRKTTKTD
ncbi:MAG TPA: hypothetical protein VD908_13115 [Cytophagales bacterium]|nr:hypothetical protein [Cytophagales bacterium]